MSKRVLINLAVFGLLGLSLAYWTVTNVISFDFIDRPYTVTAHFDTSPGLSPHFEVTYLGQRIGAIKSVKLDGDRVKVTMGIDREITVPRDVDAAVRRKSAVGEPYVDLYPTPGSNPSQGPRLGNGDSIERTSTPLAYSELFQAAARLVRSVDPADLRTLVHELSVGIDGRSDSIRQLLTGADQISTDLVANADTIDQLITDLTQITRTFADHRGSVASSFDDLAALSATLRDVQQDFIFLVEQGPTFTSTLADIIANSKSPLGCVLDGLGTVGTVLDPATIQALENTISMSPQFAFVLGGLGQPSQGAGGYLFFNNGQYGPLPVYATPLPLPGIPAVPACGDVANTVPGAGTAGVAGPGTPLGAAPAGETPGLGSRTPAPNADQQTSSTKDVGGSDLISSLFPYLLAALLIIIVGGSMWWLAAKRRRGEDDVHVAGG